jgi:hypothetical protein
MWTEAPPTLGLSAFANSTPASFDSTSTWRFVVSALSLIRIFFAEMSAAGASAADASSNAAAEMVPRLPFDMIASPSTFEC